jgi:hypothetical protein
MLGLWVRTHNLLGRTDLEAEIQKWERVGQPLEDRDIQRLYELEHPAPIPTPLWMDNRVTSEISGTLLAEVEMWKNAGVPKEEVARRLFDIKYSLNAKDVVAPPSGETKSPSEDKADRGVLYASVPPEECDNLGRLVGEKLLTEMKKSKDETILFWVSVEDDPKVLKEILDRCLCKK